MQTMEEESIPPLSSARTGWSERNLRRMDSAKTVRKRSSYSWSLVYRILLAGSKSQYLSTVAPPGRIRTKQEGGTELMPAYGVRWTAGKNDKQPAMYSSSRTKVFSENRTNGSRIVDQRTLRSASK